MHEYRENFGLEAAVSEAVGGFLELRTIATGPSAGLHVGGSTAAAFGLDTEMHNSSGADIVSLVRVEGKDPGAYGNRLEIEVRPATSGEASAFDLAVVDDGVYREVFPNLEMDPDIERYINAVINDSRSGSLLIRTIGQLAGDSLLPDVQTVALAGLDDTDFIGSDTGKTGMYAPDQVQDLSLLLIPGRATAAVHNAMVSYCEVTRDGMASAVLDPPENQSAADIVNYVTSTAALQELAEHAAIYWPRVQALNPVRSVFGPKDKIVVPPSGIIAGVQVHCRNRRHRPRWFPETQRAFSGSGQCPIF